MLRDYCGICNKKGIFDSNGKVFCHHCGWKEGAGLSGNGPTARALRLEKYRNVKVDVNKKRRC